MHDNGLVHLDIKGANILVHNGGVIKLADFGTSGKLAVTMSLNSNSLRGTPYWMAPEVIKQQVSVNSIYIIAFFLFYFFFIDLLL